MPPNAPAPAALPHIERTVSELGAKVARARGARGWSLAQLAQRAGVSAATVHKIEKGGMTPTIASLMKIASALGTSVAYFVDEPATPDVAIVRGDERAQVYTSKRGLDLRNLSGRYGGFAMAGAEAAVEPHADSGPTPMKPPRRGARDRAGGRDGVRRSTASPTRRHGDSIHFRASRQHSWRNPSDDPARVIWLVVRTS